jgi:hypothetical protein
MSVDMLCPYDVIKSKLYQLENMAKLGKTWLCKEKLGYAADTCDMP